MAIDKNTLFAFIINPVAGPTDVTVELSEKIKKICTEKGLKYEIAITERPAHAVKLAETFAHRASESNPVRVFSVGGDGNLCDSANGVIGKPYCELGCIPYGSGNDYIKCFGTAEQFRDLESYITAPSIPVDVISAGKICSMNICSLGLDAKICDRANRIKAANKRLSGPQAYEKAIVKCFFGRLYNHLTVTVDGDESKKYTGKFLFTIAASGQYYGGGFRGAPMADPTDGQLDFIMIKTMPHFKVPFRLGTYKEGRYMESKSFRKLVTHLRGSSIRIQSKKPAVLNVDGECFPINDITLRILPGAIRFIVPPGYGQDNVPADAE